jgi:FkbM family methyltransferase
MNILDYIIRKLSNRGLYKYSLVRKVYEKIRIMRSPDYVSLFGHTLFLDHRDDSDLRRQLEDYEKNTTNYMIKNINQGDNVIDVGANIGFMSLLLSKIVGQKGIVYAFEPDTTNFKILEKNIQFNSCNNIVAEQKIVSDKNGKIKFALESSGVQHHIARNDDLNVIEIDSIILDDLIKKPIKFVKIDVEGFEMNVLKGMKNIIKKNPELTLIVEFSIGNQKRAGHNYSELPTLIESLGYDMFNIETNDKVALPLSDEDILKLHGGCNLLCEPKHKNN